LVDVPLQTLPATVHSVVPGAMGVLQVPSAAPPALVQTPPQHSAPLVQASPVAVQNEPPVAHVPLVQSFPQHSAFVVQAFPVVRQPGLRGVHVPVGPQVPLQHWPELVQAWPSEVHWVVPQVPALQANVQHSCGLLQEPDALHGPVTVAQSFAPGSQ
jgi:hypothetical protein